MKSCLWIGNDKSMETAQFKLSFFLIVHNMEDYSKMKELLRDIYPDVFSLVADQGLHLNISKCSGKKIEFICPRCGSSVVQSVSQTVKLGLSCKRCGDGISFGEKFVFNVLEQLNIVFDTHVVFPWSNRRIYDVVVVCNVDNTNKIVEIHGKQHYNGGFETYGGRNQNEEAENDKYKMELAFANGFTGSTYIVVDCRESTLEYIKHSIQNNVFFKQYDLDQIDWGKCMQNAMSSYSIKAQQLWDDGYKITDISSRLNISRTTIRKYLKQGAEIGICSYSVPDSFSRRRKGTFVPAARTTLVALVDEKKIFYSIKIASEHTGVPYDYIMKYVNNLYKNLSAVRIGNKTLWIKVDQENIDAMIQNYGYVVIGEPSKNTLAS